MKNFITTLRRFKLASTLNIVGLSVAFAAFMFIMLQVRYEYTAGTDDPRADRIYRLQMLQQNEQMWGINMYMPYIEKFLTTAQGVQQNAQLLYSSATVESGEQVYDQIRAIWLTNDISKVFEVKMVEGNFASALEPNSYILSQSAAKRIFGERDAVGQTVKMYGRDVTVTGVCVDFPKNSLMYADIYGKNTNQHFSTLYVLLAPGSDPDKIASDFTRNYKKDFEGSTFGEFSLVAAEDTYFENNRVSNSFVPRGNRNVTMILLSIAILIIVIAAINFVNFSTSLAPVRIRGLNIRGVMGCTRASMRCGLIVSAMLFAGLSFVVSLFLFEIVSSSSVVGLLKVGDASLAGNLEVVIFSAIAALVVGLVAGIYPAYYCTRFRPAMVLNGSSGLSTRGTTLRTVLIGFQFTVSITLIIVATVVHMQNNYLMGHDLGYNSTSTIILRGTSERTMDIVAEGARSLPYVRSTGRYNGAFGMYDADLITQIPRTDDTMRLDCYIVNEDFLPTMEIPIIEGRNFTAEDGDYFRDPNRAIILNQKAMRMLGAHLDSTIFDGRARMRVIGVVPDVITRPMYDGISPVGYIRSGTYQMVFRIDPAAADQAMVAIREMVRGQEPVERWKLDFFDNELSSSYAKERDLALLITLFSLLAVVISLVGVFGLVMFETQYRRREIGLRKVYGSTVSEILSMFNRRFVWIVLVCFVVASPVAYYGVSRWLSGFAYRTPIHWWVFLLALLVVLFVTLFTVTVQSYRAATENPINSIRN